MTASYSRTITLDVPYDEAVPLVKEALKAQGLVSGTPGLEAIAEDAGRRIDAALAALQDG